MATKKTATKKGPREFTVHAWVSTGLAKTVTASSMREAIEKAEALAVPGLCHQCASAGRDDDDSWEVSDGLGDAPEDIGAEERDRG